MYNVYMLSYECTFSRNPKYTPALSGTVLARIELIARLGFKRWLLGLDPRTILDTDVIDGKYALKHLVLQRYIGQMRMTETYTRETRERKAHLALSIYNWIRVNSDACKYYTSCWNYMLAIARSNSEIVIEHHGAAWYAERSSGYN